MSGPFNPTLPNYNTLTIGDVYQPNQGNDYINLLNAQQNMKDAKFRNRLSAEAEGEMEWKKKQKEAMFAAAGGEQAYLARQQQQAQQQQTGEELKQGSEMIQNYKKVGGLPWVKEHWSDIDTTLPKVLQGKLNPDYITDEGYAVPIKSPDGTVIAHRITDPDGKTHTQAVTHPPKEPTSNDYTIRKQYEFELAKEHQDDPVWTPTKIASEAALKVEAKKQADALEVASKKSAMGEGREQRKEDRAEQKGFMSWTPEAKEQAFMYNLITKNPPVNATGFGGNDRKAYGKEYTQWQVDSGFKAPIVAALQTDYKAKDLSFKNMEKQEAPMRAFVDNINAQITKVEQMYTKRDRLGLRLLDMPIRDLEVSALGSGDEAVKASYLLEISNEIGKLSSGASGSVQQLSDSAKEDWKKVHDVNLSLKEIMKVVHGTRDQANMRMKSWEGAKQHVMDKMLDMGKTPQPGQPAPTSSKTWDVVITSEEGKTIDDIIARRKKGGK